MSLPKLSSLKVDGARQQRFGSVEQSAPGVVRAEVVHGDRDLVRVGFRLLLECVERFEVERFGLIELLSAIENRGEGYHVCRELPVGLRSDGSTDLESLSGQRFANGEVPARVLYPAEVVIESRDIGRARGSGRFQHEQRALVAGARVIVLAQFLSEQSERIERGGKSPRFVGIVPL